MSEYFRYNYWKDADILLSSHLQPVKVEEYGLFTTSQEGLPVLKNDDGISELCFDTILSGFAALVFCSTKQWCEQLAESMAKHVSFFHLMK